VDRVEDKRREDAIGARREDKRGVVEEIVVRGAGNIRIIAFDATFDPPTVNITRATFEYHRIPGYGPSSNN